MIPRIMIMLSVDVPKAATSTSPSRIAGIAITVSAARIQDLSEPALPEGRAKPQTVPISIAAVAANPSMIEVLPP